MLMSMRSSKSVHQRIFSSTVCKVPRKIRVTIPSRARGRHIPWMALDTGRLGMEEETKTGVLDSMLDSVLPPIQ